MPRAPVAPAPRRYHHGDLKNALLTAAGALLAERGAEGLSLREISQAAGVSHTAAYRHYADKQALLADLAEQGFRRLVATNHRTVAETEGGPVAQLQALGRAYVRFGVAEPQLLQLMFGGAITDWPAHPGLAEASHALAQSLAGVVQAGQACGELKPGPFGELTLVAWSLVHGLALLIVGQRIPGATVDAAFVEQAARRSVELLVDGLRASAPARGQPGR